MIGAKTTMISLSYLLLTKESISSRGYHLYLSLFLSLSVCCYCQGSNQRECLSFLSFSLSFSLISSSQSALRRLTDGDVLGVRSRVPFAGHNHCRSMSVLHKKQRTNYRRPDTILRNSLKTHSETTVKI